MRVRPNFMENTLLKALVLTYGGVWIATAVEPVYPTDWWLENILVFLFVPLLIATYRRFPLSDISYVCIALFLMLHAIGAHYTYAEVPLGFTLQNLLSLSRNHFDRIVHFSFGLLMAYPIREVFMRLAQARGFWGFYFPLDVTLAFSALYEIIEMFVALVVSPEAGDAYLGTQGDPFDAIKDMACAFAGSIICMLTVAVVRKSFHKGPDLLSGKT